MALGIDDLDYDYEDNDELSESNSLEQEDEGFERDDSLNYEDEDEEQSSSDEGNGLEEYLSTKGISDIHNIQFLNENGEVEGLDWNDLTKEELFNILNQEDESTALDDNEIDLINRIRLSGMSVDDYILTEVLKGISNYANSQNSENYQYTVDDISDDELFMLDLQTKIEDITDDELLQALESAKQNESIYQKQIEGLRNEYKRLEDNRNEEQQAIEVLQLQELYDQFANGIYNSINTFDSLGELNIAMEPEDADELAQFILGLDPAGINYFTKALNDPDTLVRCAWFALHGEDVVNSISNYYKDLITQHEKYSYLKGFEDARNGRSSQVVVKPNRSNKNNKKITSIDDLVD